MICGKKSNRFVDLFINHNRQKQKSNKFVEEICFSKIKKKKKFQILLINRIENVIYLFSSLIILSATVCTQTHTHF